MAKPNPVTDKDPGTRDLGNGLTALHRKEIVRSTMEMPDVSMKTNDGDNPTVASAPFATGTDNRNREGGGKTNPYPAMPGANS
jgi:hypothetical protein